MNCNCLTSLLINYKNRDSVVKRQETNTKKTPEWQFGPLVEVKRVNINAIATISFYN